MKILLIAPSQKAVYGRPLAIYPPLGLLYLAAQCELDHHTVRVLDVDAERAWGSEFMAKVREFNPDLVGITATTPTYPAALLLAARVKAEFSLPVVLGGPHPTAAGAAAIGEENVDAVVIGEGEETFAEFVRAIAAGQRDWSAINGLIWRRNNAIVQNPPRPVIPNLDRRPYPARHLIPDWGTYSPPDALHHPLTTIMTSRGCSAQCSFCSTARIFGPRVRTRSADDVISEIEHLVDRFHVREIHIADDVFTISKKRTLAICHQIANWKFDLDFFFMNGLRADQVDMETLEALRAVRFQNVAFGVETSDDWMRDAVHKRLELEQVELAIQDAKKLGFSTWLFFIIGLWGETDETVRKTIDFAKKVKPDYAKFFILKPFPGTPIYEKLKMEGCLLSSDWSQFGLYHDPVHRLPTMSPERMTYWLGKANREFYLRPQRILQQLWQLRSWTQFKSNLAALGFLKEMFVK